MTVFYLDFENGNDANAGTSFTTRWKSITSGATAARIAPGDEIRIMASPDPTLVGQATWTQYSKNITLAAPVTQMIADCEAAWTGATNVTASLETTNFKEGTRSARALIAAAFTTGKVMHFATGALDLSAYQQVSFWIMNGLALTSGMLRLCLCSDTAGNTVVHSVPVPAIPSTGQFVPVTVDLGAPLSSALASVALYADIDPGNQNVYLDNIIACKASSASDSLTLTSLIGKVCNLSWTAATAYATGDERKPTQPNRNGFRYKATTGGTTGGTEPTWPQEIGVTVTDGGVVWNCVGLEDTWYGIQSINGTTVKLDNLVNTAGNAGRGYGGSTQTVATYKRETIKPAMVASGTLVSTLQDSGTDGNLIAYSGGWSRTDMSTLAGETWLDGQNGAGQGIVCSGKAWNALRNISGVRYSAALPEPSNQLYLYHCHWVNCTNGMSWGGATPIVYGENVLFNNGSSVFSPNNPGYLRFLQFSSESNLGAVYAASSYRTTFKLTNFVARNNATTPFQLGMLMEVEFTNGTTGNTAVGSVISNPPAKCLLVNCVIPESTLVTGYATWSDIYTPSQKHNGVANSHLITAEGGTIVSATDQRFGTEGISWKLRPTSTTRNSAYPLKLSVAKIRCAANKAVSLTIPTRRDNANIKGQLIVLGGQIAGVPRDVAVDCQPSLNTWEVSSALAFTPTEDGVVEVLFRCWDGIGTTNNFWISARDLAVS